MAVLFEKTKLLTDKQFHYCPGCNHGIIHRLVAEVIDEMNLDGKVVGVAPVGCSVFAYDYFNCDMYEAAHGRAPAVATGVKRAMGPDTMVFTYQGDGDLASIGTAEIVHAAHRGEKIVTIFVNNAIYGMTGGQMAPTTLIGQKTTTSPYGRDEAWCGAPIKMSEMLAAVPSSYYIERVAVNNTANIVKAKKAIAKAFQLSEGGQGLLHGGGSVHLPHQLGYVSRGGYDLVGGEHDSLLSSGCLQRQGGQVTWKRPLFSPVSAVRACS